MSPIGVGFTEQNSEGLFHFQKLRMRAGFRCVESWTSRQTVTTERGTNAPREVLKQPDVSLVWMGPSVGIPGMRAALEAGQHVLCGLPVAESADDWRRLCEPRTTGNGSRIFVAALHRWESQLLTVQSQINHGSFGTLVDLHRISRQFVPGELSQQPVRTGPHAASVVETAGIRDWESRTFQLKWFEILDELLLLVSSPVQTVWARPTGDGRAVWIRFADGCQADIELHRRSLAPLETGWVLEGTIGGYAAGRRFRAAPDFELIDVPVEELPTDQNAFYDFLETSIRNAEPFPVTNESILRVLVLRDAIETSLRTGQAVDWNTP